MTQEFITMLNRALAVVAIAGGGFGMLLCVPYLLSVNLWIILAAGVIFLAGAVLYAAGSISMAILLQGQKEIVREVAA